jgi:hypothetical protein
MSLHNQIINQLLVDYNETLNVVTNINKLMNASNSTVIFVSPRIYDVLDMFYYIHDFIFILDPNRIFFEYGLKRKKSINNDLNTIFDYDIQ